MSNDVGAPRSNGPAGLRLDEIVRTRDRMQGLLDDALLAVASGLELEATLRRPRRPQTDPVRGGGPRRHGPGDGYLQLRPAHDG